MKNLAQEILTAPRGETFLFSVGQAGYIIKSASGKLLGVDLYLSDCVERIEGSCGFKRLLPKILGPSELILDVLIATHAHCDHFDIDATPSLMDNSVTHLLCPRSCSTWIREEWINQRRVVFMKPGMRLKVSDFTITVTTCDHGTAAPDAVGVIITVDGKRVFNAGDTSLHLENATEFLSEGPLDVLIAPINGMYGNLTELECAQLAAAVHPRVVIPCHYGMFASHGGSIGRFYDIMKNEFPFINFLLMTQGERYEF